MDCWVKPGNDGCEFQLGQLNTGTACAPAIWPNTKA